MLGIAMMDDVGALSDVAAVSVTASATSHTMTSGKRGVIYQNLGTKDVFIGGATVDGDSNRGILLYPGSMFQFRNAKEGHKAFFVCKTGDTSTIGVVEYD